MENEAPSFTRLAACFRFAGVIRFTAPDSSCFPHRPQLESFIKQVVEICSGQDRMRVCLPAGIQQAKPQNDCGA